jgi:hypothetical protein
VSGLRQEFAAWQAGVAEITAQSGGDVARLPLVLRETLDAGSGAFLVVGAADATRVIPPGALLHAVPGLIDAPVAGAMMPPAFTTAEAIEFRQRDYAGASQAYAAVALSTDPHVRAGALAAQARVLRKAGRRREAREVYAKLGALSGARAGVLPAELIATDAACEMAAEDDRHDDLTPCALGFYRALVEGRWLLESVRYLAYVERAQSWLAAGGATSAATMDLETLEARKTDLTRLAALAVEARGTGTPGRFGQAVLRDHRGAGLVFWRDGQDPASRVMLVLAPDAVTRHVWPRAFAAALAGTVRLSVVAPDGSLLFRSDSGTSVSNVNDSAASTRDWQDGDFLWRIRAASRDPSALYEGLRSRQLLYSASTSAPTTTSPSREQPAVEDRARAVAPAVRDQRPRPGLPFRRVTRAPVVNRRGRHGPVITSVPSGQTRRKSSGFSVSSRSADALRAARAMSAS